jgi:demethylmenaquinone methyltransferase/2-methoxy-6-polyprenyl-1,4-benzoquinol methylase
MFNALAVRYDIFNRLTSMGMDNYWRKAALAAVKPGMRVLDIGCGTGDLALGAASKMGRGGGEVVGLDFSEKMLAVAQTRFKKAKHVMAPVRWVALKAEDIPFEDVRYDLILSGFVLRNIYENIDLILQGMREALSTGGKIRLLDFTEPPSRAWKKMWQFYMNTAVRVYGRILFGKQFPDTYLTRSAARFAKPAEFMSKLRGAGFKNIESQLFLGGIIVLYKADK